MISTALVALALVPSLVAETQTAHEQQVRDQSAVTMSLEELGLSVGWSEAHRRLNGCRGEFHHRVVEGSSVTLEGLHAVSWAADSVRIEKLESRGQGSRADSAQMVEEYFPARGEFVNLEIKPGHAPNAIVACMQSVPTFAASVFGILDPALRTQHVRVECGEGGFLLRGGGSEIQIEVRGRALESPIPATWRIIRGKSEEVIHLDAPWIDPSTKRMMPGLVVLEESTDGVVLRRSSWLRVRAGAANGYPAAFAVGVLISDLRQAGWSQLLTSDRALGTRDVSAWLESSAPPGAGATRFGGADLLSFPVRSDEQQLAHLPDPLRDPDGWTASRRPGRANLVGQAAASLGLEPAEPGAPVVLLDVVGLPKITGNVVADWRLVPASPRDAASPSRAGTAVQASPPADHLVEDVLRLSQTDEGSSAEGRLTLAARPGSESPLRLVGVSNPHGIELLDGLPVELADEPRRITLRIPLDRPLPRAIHPCVKLEFDSGDVLLVPVEFHVPRPFVRCEPPEVRASAGSVAELVSFSDAHDIVDWKWLSPPDCVDVKSVGSDSGSHAWSIQAKPVAALRHKCPGLRARVYLRSRGADPEVSPTRVTIQVPLLHDPSPRDEEGRLLLGTLLVPGERLGLVERPGQPPALWLPDRIWGDSTSWLNGAARLTVVRIPASLAGEVIDWVPAESVGIRVLARVAPSSTGCDELWARGAALQ